MVNKTIFVTHDGRFHCDEVLACALFRHLYPSGEIRRTRDLNQLETDKEEKVFYVDVGGKYDVDANMFDHHQDDDSSITFDDSTKIPLAASGLFYKEYGISCIRNIITSFNDISDTNLASGYIPDYGLISKKLYYEFINEIQAHDNGIWNEYVKPVAYPTFLHLPQIVSRFNDFTNDCMGPTQEENFMKAVQLVDSILCQTLRNIYDTERLYYDLVQRKFKAEDQDTVTLHDSRHTTVINRFLKNSSQKHFMIYQESDAKKNQYFAVKRLAGSKRKLTRPKSLDDVEFKEKVICIHKNGFMAKVCDQDTLKRIIKTSQQ